MKLFLEELSIQLSRNGRRGGCLGNLNIKIRDKWELVCQKSITTDLSSEAAATAMVACRELGCGLALDWRRVVDRSMSLITTAGIRCSGSERQIRECPTEDLVCSDINTLSIVCSGEREKHNVTLKILYVRKLLFCLINAPALTFNLTDAMPPPQLSVVAYGPVSTLYVNDKQSVKITCAFSSPYLKSDDIVTNPSHILKTNMLFNLCK